MTKPVLELNNLACRRGGRVLFADLDLRLEEGDAAVVTGPNGSGKSSLLRVIAGLIPPFIGEVLWNGQNTRKNPDSFRSAVRYVGHSDGLQPALSVLDNLRFWANIYGSANNFGSLRRGLEAVGLADLMGLPANVLSAGQRRRLALARAVATNGKLWLLDEPTVALDTQSVEEIESIITDFRAAGGMVFASTNAPLKLERSKSVNLSEFSWEIEN